MTVNAHKEEGKEKNQFHSYWDTQTTCLKWESQTKKGTDTLCSNPKDVKAKSNVGQKLCFSSTWWTCCMILMPCMVKKSCARKKNHYIEREKRWKNFPEPHVCSQCPGYAKFKVLVTPPCQDVSSCYWETSSQVPTPSPACTEALG